MGVAEVVAVLRADTSQFIAKMGEADATVTKLSKNGASNFEKLASVGKMALLGLAAGAVVVGTAAVDMADKYENAHAQLNNAFKNAGTSSSKYQGQINDLQNQMAHWGYTSAQVQSALGQLVTVTGNAQASINNMGLAADIAANRHMDLNSAATLMAKTMAGNVTAAKRMGIEIPAAVLKIKDPTEKANDVLAILEARFKGSASAAADTFSGRIAAMKAQGENLLTVIGLKLIPVLEKLLTQIMQLVTWFEKHKTIAEALAFVMGGALVTAITAATVAWIADAAATVAATWPILAIIAAIALVVAAIIYLSTHWHQVWTDIKNWAADAINWLTSHIPGLNIYIDAIRIEISTLRDIFTEAWTIIKAAVSDAWAFIQPIWSAIITGANDVGKAIGDVTNAVKSVGNFAGGALSTITGGLLANGGPASANVPYIVGERGPELFVPNTSGVVIPNNALTKNTPAGAGVVAGVTGTSQTINVYATTNADPNQIATAMAWEIGRAHV